MQASDPTQQRDGFESITVFADGEPLLLELTGWTPDAIGASTPVYQRPVGSAADAYYKVTVDQIRLIAEASDIRLRTTGTSSIEYHLWDGQNTAHRGFEAFLQAALY
ncbi:MAG: hypothetical protein OER97_10100 [Gammaproteobacteria bacterium]|nr:hypothetical protein [Gammaproteobacteria bacterium]